MKYLSILLMIGLFSNPAASSAHAEEPAKLNNLRWYIVNDGVMGGLSSGRYQQTPDQTGLFTGNLSLENNGGFSWLKTRPAELGLSGKSGVKIRVKGDGRTYALTLKNGERRRALYFASFFETTPDTWMEIELPLKNFKGYFYGQNVNPVTAMNPDLMSELGFILLDKKEGPFALEIGDILVY